MDKKIKIVEEKSDKIKKNIQKAEEGIKVVKEASGAIREIMKRFNL